MTTNKTARKTKKSDETENAELVAHNTHKLALEKRVKDLNKRLNTLAFERLAIAKQAWKDAGGCEICHGVGDYRIMSDMYEYCGCDKSKSRPAGFPPPSSQWVTTIENFYHATSVIKWAPTPELEALAAELADARVAADDFNVRPLKGDVVIVTRGRKGFAKVGVIFWLRDGRAGVTLVDGETVWVDWMYLDKAHLVDEATKRELVEVTAKQAREKYAASKK